ncbi:hypothetical protein B0H14DRAFT_3616046 [Mycena olivaceomarginata]|nr:hypothetical protein B0H14DRAFT_3616046 [Mycena olivaceomarginata]
MTLSRVTRTCNRCGVRRRSACRQPDIQQPLWRAFLMSPRQHLRERAIVIALNISANLQELQVEPRKDVCPFNLELERRHLTSDRLALIELEMLHGAHGKEEVLQERNRGVQDERNIRDRSPTTSGRPTICRTAGPSAEPKRIKPCSQLKGAARRAKTQVLSPPTRRAPGGGQLFERKIDLREEEYVGVMEQWNLADDNERIRTRWQ